MNAPLVPAIQGEPDLTALHTLLKRGKYLSLRQKAFRAVKRYPRNARLHGYLGAACVGMSDLEAGIRHFRRAIEIDDTIPALFRDLGNIYFAQSEFRKAQELYLKVQAMGEGDADLMSRIGMSLAHSQRLREAFVQLANALSADPENPKYAAALGEAFEMGGLYKEAISSLEIATRLAPQNGTYQLVLARCHYQNGDSVQALSVADAAQERGADGGECQTLRAAILGSLGRQAEAQLASRAALLDGKAKGSQFYNFAMRHDMAAEPKILRKLDRGLRKPGVPERRSMHFAMAKAQEDLGDNSEAYKHYQQGNRLQKQELGYDVGQDIERLSSMQKVFEGAQALPAKTSQNKVNPIFIVGMPRSGSTLAEAILARHPLVTACGELNALLQSVVISLDDQEPPTGDQCASFADSYRCRLPSDAHSATFATDKMPENFRLIGYILTAIPEARIIHSKRDARAVCWSNFKTSYSGKGNGFTYNGDDLVQYFMAYQTLMAFWHRQFPGRIFDLNYSALVAEPEPNIRAMLDYISLPWDAACLKPEEGEHAVKTASQSQIRQPIYSGSDLEWKKYQELADDWLSALPGGGSDKD